MGKRVMGLVSYPILVFSFIFLMVMPSVLPAIEKGEIPSQLQDWIPWVLKDHKDHSCPLIYNSSQQFQCVWASALELRVHEKQGQFLQTINVLSEHWVQIPGNYDNWPQNVTLQGKAAIVTLRNNLPSVFLKKGTYRLTGDFIWQKTPEFIQLPRSTGIVKFWFQNQRIHFPNLDEEGRLWIQKTDKKATNQKPTVDIKVFRKISDTIPTIVSTHIVLNYSGEADELVIGNPILDGFIPLSLKSDLPVKLKTDQSLHIQARPGEWTILVNARSLELRNDLTLKAPNSLWLDEEIWVFESQNHLRETKITGGQIIDPQQTDLPKDWKKLPAYLMRDGDHFRIEEIKRGNPQPADNQLSLTRDIWLDFDGKGYIARDIIEGTMNRDWRLLAKDTTIPGRVSVNGKDRLITEYKDGRKGIEIRSRQINTIAESRIEPRLSQVSAVGWEHDFDSLGSTIHFSPGWKVWHIFGADKVSGSWISNWSLLDLFMVFIVFLSVVKLWGRYWGILTLVTLLLTYHLPGSPRWIWLHIIVSFALFKVFPEGWIKRLINLYRLISMVILIIIVLPFMVQQAREGLYPQLEKRGGAITYTMEESEPEYDYKEEDHMLVESEQAPQQQVSKQEVYERKGPSRKKMLTKTDLPQSVDKQSFREFDPNAKVQTGPGIPNWTWNRVNLNWNGPVDKEQTIRLMITPPWFKRILNFANALFWGSILIFIMGIRYDGKKGLSIPKISWKELFSIFSRGSAVLIVVLMPFNQSHADIPSETLLNKLKAELLKPPKCAPKCTSVPNVEIKIQHSNLRIRMEAHVQADSAFPLPDAMGQWSIKNIWNNGKPINSFSNDSSNRLLIHLPPGRHQLQIQGVLENKPIIQINFPLRPHRTSISSTGWKVEGVYQNRMVGNHIQFKKTSKATVKSAASKPDFKDLPAFVKIERFIKLGLNWQVETIISRMSGPEDTIIIQLPLLAGESITSEQLKLVDGKAEIQLAPFQHEKKIHSVFEKNDRFKLSATNTSEWIEIWKVYISPLWHATFSGIPEIHHRNQTDKYLPEWRPWPGESIEVEITRPTAVAGQTKTIDQSRLTFDVGRRTVSTELSFQLRSSLGGRHTVILPENSKLRSLTINENEQPFQQQDQKITFPVFPGAQNISLYWNQKKDISIFHKSPEIKLGTESVNATIQVTLPSERWILGVSGPVLGPAILFWGNLFVLLVISFGLGRLKTTPLKSRHWMILALGLSGVSIYFMFIFAVWILAVGFRRKMDQHTNKLLFDLTQILLVALFIAAMVALYQTIRTGLLGGPEMLITGNGSYYNTLNWFQDRSRDILPQVSVFSLPIMAYRIAMLLWALWLAFSLIKWLRWSWESYTINGLWKSLGVVEIFFKKKDDKSKEDHPKS